MPKRSYHSPLREQQAKESRNRILTAALHCFEEHGYAGTTLRMIAEAAGMSAESVQLSGPKRRLLIDAFTLATTGDEAHRDTPLLDLPGPRIEFAMPSGNDALRALMTWIADSNLRIWRIWRALEQAAEHDEDVREEFDALLVRMRNESLRAVTSLVKRGLRSDVPLRELADHLWLLALPDQYHRLCEQSGWSHAKYRRWLCRASSELLFPNA